MFTYDTTLRVPLIVAGAGIARRPGRARRRCRWSTSRRRSPSLAGLGPFESRRARCCRAARPSTPRTPRVLERLYAESFAPLLDFGWSPLRTMRQGDWKYIAAPKPELYDLNGDPGETRNVVAQQPTQRRGARAAGGRDFAGDARPPELQRRRIREALARLQALGYASGRGDARRRSAGSRRIAASSRRGSRGSTSGELQGAALERALRDILREDPRNPQANLRLGYVLVSSGPLRARRSRASPPRSTARLPSADAHLGRAGVRSGGRRPRRGASARWSRRRRSSRTTRSSAPISVWCSPTPASRLRRIPHLQRALSLDPDLHQARFGLAIAYAPNRPPSRRGEGGPGAAAPAPRRRPPAAGSRTTPGRRALTDPRTDSGFVKPTIWIGLTGLR